MSVFDYLSVLFSVIMGLALTEVLQDFRDLIQARKRVVIYWPALIWAGLMILIVVQAWWGMFAMRGFDHWTFAMYGSVVFQITLMYLAAGAVLPKVPEEGPVDMERGYYDNHGWFFGLLALTLFATFLKDYVCIGRMVVSTNTWYLVTYLVASVIAAVVRNRWYHALLAPVSIVAISASAVLLSFRI